MKTVRTVLLVLSTLPIWCQSGKVEPTAGTWKTWAITSGKDYRVPPPPSGAAADFELDWVRSFSAQTDPRIAPQVAFWDAGAPSYRWIDLLSNRALAGQQVGSRVYGYVAMAIYDATVAAWDSKYFYNRLRPSEVDPALKTRLPVPQSPSYPSDYGATAAAAAEVLSYFFPNEAASFKSMSEEAARSRLYAGLEFPSDYFAGLELGRQVAAKVIALAKADRSVIPFTGTIPTGPCRWIGTNPANAAAANWKPLLLTAPNEFRPPVPPACDSPQVVAETTAVRNFPRSAAAFVTNSKAFYWQMPEGLNTWPYVYANKWMAEDKLDANPPRAARVYALIALSYFDTFIASQDGKFAYWYIRPHQLDSAIVPIFPVPNFPSYPSNHSSFSATRSEMLAYLFPTRADLIRAVGKEAGDSRIWAGLHYEIDNVSGVELGKKVAQKFIDWANRDGSQ